MIEIKKIEKIFNKKVLRIEDKDTTSICNFKDGSVAIIYKSGEFEKEMTEIHNKSIQILTKCSLKTLQKILGFCNQILKHEPTVSNYKEVVETLVSLLEQAYKEINEPNELHYFIKEIDPSIYGRAENLIKHTILLQKRTEEVITVKKKGIKIIKEKTKNG